MNFFFLGINDLPWHHLMSEKETRLSTPTVWQTYWKTNRPHIKRPNFTELGIGTLQHFYVILRFAAASIILQCHP